jgi:hypothetical protein
MSVAQAFSVFSIDDYVEVWPSVADAGDVALQQTVDGETLTIIVNAEDLARALITASPAFAKSIGLIARHAIVTVLDRDSDSAQL